MNVSFKPIALDLVLSDLQAHLNSLPSPIDSFLEDHILKSSHFEIRMDDVRAGFASIHNSTLITQFVLKDLYKTWGQLVFARVKRLEQVQAAFVPTCDEFFLSHALDQYRTLHLQAYFFAAPSSVTVEHIPSSLVLKVATESDLEFIREKSEGFFNALETRIQQGEVFLALDDQNCIGFGILERSKLVPSTASMGLMVLEKYRQRGFGTALIGVLQAHCLGQNLRPVAGCWYYNHASKRTLERAGMFTQTRLLKIEF